MLGGNRRGCVRLGGFRPRIGEGVLGWVVLDLEQERVCCVGWF